MLTTGWIRKSSWCTGSQGKRCCWRICCGCCCDGGCIPILKSKNKNRIKKLRSKNLEFIFNSFKGLPVKQEKTWLNSYISCSFGCSNICNLKKRIKSKWYNVFSMVGENLILLANKNQNTVNSQFKKDLNLQINSANRFS